MSDCVEWKYAKSDKGYGNFRLNGKTRSVHRFVFGLYHGYLPRVVMHTCDNPSCYNIEHLKGGTHKDNTQDMISKGRKAVKRGEGHEKAKLNEGQVHDIRRRMKAGVRIKDIAEDFGVSWSCIWHIKTGSRWAWLPLQGDKNAD